MNVNSIPKRELCHHMRVEFQCQYYDGATCHSLLGLGYGAFTVCSLISNPAFEYQLLNFECLLVASDWHRIVILRTLYVHCMIRLSNSLLSIDSNILVFYLGDFSAKVFQTNKWE
jgi:hypothetical protein